MNLCQRTVRQGECFIYSTSVSLTKSIITSDHRRCFPLREKGYLSQISNNKIKYYVNQSINKIISDAFII